MITPLRRAPSFFRRVRPHQGTPVGAMGVNPSGLVPPPICFRRRMTSVMLVAATLLLLAAAPTARGQAAGSLDSLNANITGVPIGDSIPDVLAMAMQPDGKMIIAGDFTSVLGVARSNIARLNANGSLDLDFDPQVNNGSEGGVACMALQADGKIIIGGSFTDVGGTFRGYIARLNANGSLDPGFDPEADFNVLSVVLQPDGMILIGGLFDTLQPNGAVDPTPRGGIARLDANGNLDTGFDPQAIGDGIRQIDSIAVQADGKILLGGRFNSLQPNGAASATPRLNIARINDNGTLDTSFDPKANDPVFSVALQADGKILLAGTFTTLQPNGAVSATSRLCIARVNSDGSLDTGFNPKADGAFRLVLSTALQADGKILLGGYFTTLQPNGAASATTRNRIARLNASGSLDTAFNPNADGSVDGVTLQPDGKILVGGSFTKLQPNGAPSPTTRNLFARLNNDAATQTLSAPSATQVQWQRGGSSPEVSQVTFEQSTDGGANWSDLGKGTRVGTTPNWQLTGLSLPASGKLRARGRTASGYLNGSSTVLEQVADFIPGVSPAPEIAISGNGVEIADGDTTPDAADHSDFGNAGVTGATVVRTFTVANTGNAVLNLTGTPKVVIGGTHAADFTVNIQPASTVAATTGTTTFQVTFHPSATGIRSASVSVANDDFDESSYTFSIQGKGVNSGTLAFAVTAVSASEGGLATIAVKRSIGTDGDVTVKVSTSSVGGTATAGADYTVVTNQLITFLDGETTQDVTFQTTNEVPNVVENNETFTVTLSTPGGGAVLGSPASAKVTIIDPSILTFSGDNIAPGVTLTSPVSGSTLGVNTGANLTFAGSASDNKGVRKVQYSLNGAAFSDLDATALATPGGTTTAYTAALLPVSGSNTLRVRSVDFATGAGNAIVTSSSTSSPTVAVQSVPLGLVVNSTFLGQSVTAIVGTTVTLSGPANANISPGPVSAPFTTTDRVSSVVTSTFKVLRPLTVQIAGNGSVTPAGFTPSSYREVGQKFLLTALPAATPAPGNLFKNWSIESPHSSSSLGIPASALERPTLNFLHRDGLILRANFVPNPYLLLGTNSAGVSGVEYNGLIRANSSEPAPNGTRPGNSTEGLLTATVTSTGAFSGKLTIDGSALTLAGVFDHMGAARFGTSRATELAITRPNQPSLVVALGIDLDSGRVKDTISGSVVATDFKRSVVVATSNVTADRAFYDGLTGPTTVPAAYLGAANATQSYTVVLPSLSTTYQPAGITDRDYPQGDGYGFLTISRAGLVTLTAGKLADGATWTTLSTKLSKDNKFPFFLQLYNKLGYLSGDVALDSSNVKSDFAATNHGFDWLRPIDLSSQYYPGGWLEIIRVDFMGARYATTFTPASSVLRMADGADADLIGDPLLPADLANGNVNLNFFSGQLTEIMNRRASISPTNAVTRVPLSDTGFMLTLTAGTGVFGGSFVHENDQGVTAPATTPFEGVIFQKGPDAGGYGFFLTRKPNPIDYTGASGAVNLMGNF